MVTDLAFEPPSDLGVDVTGLPPRRARMARFQAWRARAADDLAALEGGRAKLAERIAEVERVLERNAAENEAQAASLAEQVKRGADWALTTVRKRPAEVPDLSIARAAAVRLDAEIAAKREQVEAIDARLPGVMNAVLVEEAARIGAEYQAALNVAGGLMTALEGLNVAIGRGRDTRLTGEMPGFGVAGHELEITPIAATRSEVAAAAGVWRSLARALAADPRADPTKLLRFAPCDPSAIAGVVYHELSAVERRLVDFRAASTAH